MKTRTGFFEAVSILVGTMIGAGIFALPYAVHQIGLLPGLFVMMVVALMVLLLYLLLGELSLSTRGVRHFTGFAEVYLGKWGKWVMLFTMAVCMYLPLLAYTVAQGEILSTLFGGQQQVWSLAYYIFCASCIFFGMKLFKKFEFYVTLIFILLVVFITLFAMPSFSIDNITHIDWTKVVMPYGVILFAFGGGSAVPLMRLALKGQEEKLRSAMITGVAIVFLLYIVFAFVLAGAIGADISPIVTLSLGKTLGPVVLLIANVFAFFAMTSCFLSLGSSLQLMYQNDFKLHKITAWILTISFPLILFLMGFNNFFSLINLSGSVAGGLESLLILIIYWRLRQLHKTGRTPEYKLHQYFPIIVILSLMFLSGFIYSLVNVL